jgi:hypothetical protein
MIRSQVERRDLECWIDRDGRIVRYECSDNECESVVSFHVEAARQHFQYSANAERGAENAGWIKLNCPYTHKATCTKKPSSFQIKKLIELGHKSFLLVGFGIIELTGDNPYK